MQTTPSHRYVPMADPRVPPYPPIELVSEDNENMDSEWHRMAMTLLIESIRLHFAGREDYYAGGDMFIYFNEQQARDRDFRGPDFFFVWGRPLNPPRQWWAVWEEDGKFPDVIVELLSHSTSSSDLGVKREVYQDIFKTPEYFCFDPADNALLGWRLENDAYVPIEPNEKGRLWSNRLRLWIGAWDGMAFPFRGTWPRFFRIDGDLILSPREKLIRIEQSHRDIEKRSEAGWEQASREGARADAEAMIAEAERLRADALEAELARLRAQLGDAGNPQL
jgi:Uma2 family endonuclease